MVRTFLNKKEGWRLQGGAEERIKIVY